MRPHLSLGTNTDRSASLAFGDVDADGDLDLVVANGRHWAEQNEIFLNNGAGFFGLARPLGDERATSYAAPLADLDGDGDLDAAVGNDKVRNRVYLNDGTGRFTAAGPFGQPTSATRGVTLADLNGDGHTDLVVTNRGEQNWIYFNDGQAGFDDARPFGASDDSTISLAAVDLDDDGDLDLALANRDGQPNFCYLNDGAGDFEEAGGFGTGSDETRAVVAADLDGDGHADLVSANIGEPNGVHFGDGRGGFENAGFFGRPDGRSYAVRAADLDNDGDVDIVIGNVGGENALFLNNGTGLVYEEQRFGEAEGNTYGVAVGDVNGDGWVDVAVSNSDGLNRIFRNLLGRKTAGPSAQADEAERYWPQWRGPHHNGVAPHSDPPIAWSETENIRFKVEVPGRGLASPVVWGDKIFLLTAVAADADAYQASQQAAAEKLEKKEWPPSVEPVKQAFLVLALSRRDGSVLWRKTAAERVPHESHYLDSSWASASPVTDGERLFAHFGSNGLYAYDLEGELLWSVDLGDMTTRRGFGEGSSPALHGDTLVVNWDHEGDSFIVALDARSGEERWRTERPDEVTSWATPLVVESGGRLQVVVPATGMSRGYDLETGREMWSATGMTVNTIPTPVHRDGIVYLTSGYRGNLMQAIALAKARGPVNDTEAMVWTFDRHTPYVPSPVLYEDRICFIKHLRNIFTCLDATTGGVLYTEKRLPGITNVYASPVAAAGRLYIFAKDGKAVVLDAGGEYKVLATNALDDGVNASPAIAGDEIFLRSNRYLYAIGAQGSVRFP